jgi:hypothetical protein
LTIFFPLFILLVWMVPFLHVKIGLGTYLINAMFEYINDNLERDDIRVLTARKTAAELLAAMKKANKAITDFRNSYAGGSAGYDKDVNGLKAREKILKDIAAKKALILSDPSSRLRKGWDAQLQTLINKMTDAAKASPSYVEGTQQNTRLLKGIAGFCLKLKELEDLLAKAKAKYDAEKKKLKDLLSDRKTGRCVPPSKNYYHKRESIGKYITRTLLMEDTFLVS